MAEAQIATSLGIVLLVALSTHIFYRRPPEVLWPALPLVFFSALIFSLGDLLATVWPNNATLRWAGSILIYTGLLTIAPGWWLFTRGFSEMTGYRKVAFRWGLPWLATINALLWISMITNPWHGQLMTPVVGEEEIKTDLHTSRSLQSKRAAHKTPGFAHPVRSIGSP